MEKNLNRHGKGRPRLGKLRRKHLPQMTADPRLIRQLRQFSAINNQVSMSMHVETAIKEYLEGENEGLPNIDEMLSDSEENFDENNLEEI